MKHKKILVYIPARLGDALMQSPVISLIIKNIKNVSVDILATSSIGVDLYQNNPNVSKVIKYDNKGAFQKLSADYDFFLIAHHDSHSADLVYKINCKALVIEYADKNIHQARQNTEFINSFLLSKNALMEIECLYEIYPTILDYSFAKNKLEQNKKYIGFHFGCHGLAKSRMWFWKSANFKHQKAWAIENYIELGKLIRAKYPSVLFVLTGSSEEEKIAFKFMQTFPETISLFGNTNIGQLKSIIEKLTVFISGDTGPMHVACSTFTPMLTLFGNTNPIRTGPYPPTQYRKIIQNDSIELITPEEAFAVVDSLLNY